MSFLDSLLRMFGLKTRGESRAREEARVSAKEEARARHQAAAREAAEETAKPATAIAIDPVCKMEVDTANPPGGASEHEGQTYYFCAPGCKTSFDQEPQKYLAAS